VIPSENEFVRPLLFNEIPGRGNGRFRESPEGVPIEVDETIADDEQVP
jgi:hypothetical protein